MHTKNKMEEFFLLAIAAMDSSAQKLSKKEQAFADAKGRGNAAVSAGDYVAAIESYTEALKAAPATYFDPEGPAAAVLSNRSFAHLNCGFFEKALQDANDCIKLRPDWAKSHFRRYARLLVLVASCHQALSHRRSRAFQRPGTHTMPDIVKCQG